MWCITVVNRTFIIIFHKNVNNINQRITYYIGLQALMYLRRNERRHTSKLIVLDRNSHGKFHARPEAFALLLYTEEIPRIDITYN